MSVQQMTSVWGLDLPPNLKLVLLAYADHADPDGDNVFPSMARIAHMTGYSRDQIKRITKTLVDSQLMKRVAPPEPRRPPRYVLTLWNGTALTPFRQRVQNAPPDSREGANEPPQVGASMPPEPPEEPPSTTSTSLQSDDCKGSDADSGDGYPDDSKTDKDEKPPGMSWLALVMERVDEVDFQPTPKQKVTWGAGFRRYTTAPEGHHPPRHDEIMRVVSKIVESASAGYFMSVDKALERLGSGASASKGEDGEEPTRRGGSPEDVIEAVLNRDALRHYGPQLRRFDFTSGDEPPPAIVLALGGTSDEQQRNLERIRSIARQTVRARESE